MNESRVDSTKLGEIPPFNGSEKIKREKIKGKRKEKEERRKKEEERVKERKKRGKIIGKSKEYKKTLKI